MTTTNQVEAKVVAESIDHDYIQDCGKSLKEIYYDEFGSWNGTTPEACRSYLQGLPSVCTVLFWNNEILELLAKEGITRKTASGQNAIVENYWNAVGYQFYKLVK